MRSRTSACGALCRVIFALLVLLLLGTDQVSAREVIPAPENGGPGLTVYPPDNAPSAPGMVGTIPDFDGTIPATMTAKNGAPKSDDIGGDDVLVLDNEEIEGTSMDIAANGDIYLAIGREHTYSAWIEVYRSSDNGATFALWGTIGGGDQYYDEMPHLRVVEGDISYCLVVFQSSNLYHTRDAVLLQGAPLGGSTAAWDLFTTVMEDPDQDFRNPRFDTDVYSWSGFYIYVVASGDETGGSTGDDIWFARSTDLGSSFETPYMLATLAVADRHYDYPDISYGYGGHLHTCWEFRYDDGSGDRSVRYRRASSYASGGLADWDYWITMTTSSDGYHDILPTIEGGHASDDVAIIYARWTALKRDRAYADTQVVVSDDTGVSWGSAVAVSDGPNRAVELVEDPSSGTWYLLGHRSGTGANIWTADASDLTDWSGPQAFGDAWRQNIYYFPPSIALNPTKSNRPATAWVETGYGTGSYQVYFDAAWRNDPGYPNLEPGFPLGIWAAPRSAPAVVDVDGDDDLEIVFADGLNQIQVFDHDGGSAPGWPVSVGAPLSDAPVAVGHLDHSGEPVLVVGTTDGRVFAYDADGSLRPGWPITLSSVSGDVYVSIGALGGPYLRTIVACGDDRLFYRGHLGSELPNVPYWFFGNAHDFTAPPAIGDIDNDGVAEVVCALGTSVYAMEMHQTSLELYVDLGEIVSDAPTLGDLDLDGDLEIAVPTVDGTLHAIHHDGTPVTGFPFDSGTSFDMTSAAIAQCLGTLYPELAFGRQDNTVHMLQYTGSEATGYPNTTGSGWWLWGAPIIGRVDGTSADVVVGARDEQGWAWSNVGILVEGWPVDAGSFVHVSPAMGDLDLDGAVEVVFVSDTQLLVMDINNTETDPHRTWPMYGHDPQRTGCSDCPEDLVTAVDPDAPGSGVTRVSFAPPSPNPSYGAATFQFALPVRAAVSLDIFDLRGRRVYTAYREETEPGVKTVDWHGRDKRGERLASGQYFARLRVRGPGVSELLTRKVTLVR